MEFVKKNVILIVSALAVVVALVSLIFAFTQIAKVQSDLNASKATGDKVEQLLKGEKPEGSDQPAQVVNEQAVIALQQFNRGMRDNVQAIKQKILGFNSRNYELLMEDVFPQPADASKPFIFRGVYSHAFDSFLDTLQAGDAPTAEYVRWVEERLRLHMAPDLGEIRGADDEYGLFYRSDRQMGDRIPNMQNQALLRAWIDVAQEKRMYANMQAFDISGLVNGSDPPSVDEMWDAQLGWWVQRNVVEALANVNAAAAAEKEKARSQGQQVEELNVFDAPVKHLLSIQVGGYVTQGTGGGMGGAGGLGHAIGPMAGPMGGMGGGAMGRGGGGLRTSGSGGGKTQSFTNRACNEDYDVVTFSISLICDNRDLCLVLKEMAKENLITQTGMNIEAYEGGDTGRQGVGYIYGDAPLVLVNLDFEMYLYTKIYHQSMPETVKQVLSGGGAGGGMGGPMDMGGGMGPAMGPGAPR